MTSKTKTHYPSLFQPISIGRLKIKNRLVVPPIGTLFGDFNGHMDNRLGAYLKQRAKGGFGLIIAEGVAVDSAGRGGPRHFGIWDDGFIPEYKQLVDCVHEHGAKIALQLMHAGRNTRPDNIYGQNPIAPSAVADPVIRYTPQELTKEGIRKVVDSFVQAARRCKEAGFDAIEIHGGHGYLISEFMSFYANKRNDEYGGGIDGFMRFPSEIVTKMKEVLGSEFPVIFRISAEEGVINGRTLDESVEMAIRLTAIGVDAIHVTIGVYETSYLTMAPPDLEQGFNVNAAAAIKSAVSIPVIAVGRIHDPDLAEQVVSSGKADMVSLGRQSLADPFWPVKVAENRKEEIVKCLSCLECLNVTWHAEPIRCVQNPFLGRETEFESHRTTRPRKLVVAGGGPAGLEAARAAVTLGHKVALFEKELFLGGQILIAAVPPKKELLKEVVLSRIRALKEAGVEIITGKELTADIVKDLKPDVLIVATGSVPLVPDIPGIQNKNVIVAADVLKGQSVGDKVLIVGGGIIGCETADFLSHQGKKVIIIEMLRSIARDMLPSSRFFLKKRLSEKHVDIFTSTTVKRIENDYVTIISEKGEQTLNAIDHVILAAGVQPINTLASKLHGIVPKIIVIGDAHKPGKIFQAIHQAVEAVLSL